MKKKNIISLYAIVLGLSLTGCNLQFETLANDIKEDIVHEIEVNISSELAEIVDNTNFKDEESLQNLADEIVAWGDSYSEQDENLKEFQQATLVRVVDGDTIVVEIKDEEYKVRMIGVNTPESVASEEYLEKTGKENTQEGKDASLYLKDLLSEYSDVYLEKDVSETDRYGRLLRYVWLEEPVDKYDITEVTSKMVNGILLKDGIAEVTIYDPDDEYEDIFKEIDENR